MVGTTQLLSKVAMKKPAAHTSEDDDACDEEEAEEEDPPENYEIIVDFTQDLVDFSDKPNGDLMGASQKDDEKNVLADAPDNSGVDNSQQIAAYEELDAAMALLDQGLDGKTPIQQFTTTPAKQIQADKALATELANLGTSTPMLQLEADRSAAEDLHASMNGGSPPKLVSFSASPSSASSSSSSQTPASGSASASSASGSKSPSKKELLKIQLEAMKAQQP